MSLFTTTTHTEQTAWDCLLFPTAAVPAGADVTVGPLPLCRRGSAPCPETASAGLASSARFLAAGAREVGAPLHGLNFQQPCRLPSQPSPAMTAQTLPDLLTVVAVDSFNAPSWSTTGWRVWFVLQLYTLSGVNLQYWQFLTLVIYSAFCHFAVNHYFRVV